jgi:hypothetical protein
MKDDNRDYAEDVNYFGTSRTSPDEWLDRAKREIRSAGGVIHGCASIDEETSGRSAFCLAFELQGERFQMKWPVLLSKKGNTRAAKIQAATALYHEVKAACLKAKFLGTRAAFLAYLSLPDGRTVSEASMPDLMAALPKMLVAGTEQ